MTRLSFRTALRAVAALVLAAAVIHGAWYWYLPDYAVTRSAHPSVLRTILLMNAALTLTLLLMALATWFVTASPAVTQRQLRLYAIFLWVFWAGRLALEFFIPLSIPLLFIERPQLLAKLIIATPVLLLSAALVTNRQVDAD